MSDIKDKIFAEYVKQIELEKQATKLKKQLDKTQAELTQHYLDFDKLLTSAELIEGDVIAQDKEVHPGVLLNLYIVKTRPSSSIKILKLLDLKNI